MYVYRGHSTMGFSLKPPSWLRSIAGAVVRGFQVTVPTPLGPQVFDLGNPSDIAALQKIATGTKIGTRPPASPLEKISESVPGGLSTLAVVGVAVLAVMFFAGKASRGGRG